MLNGVLTYDATGNPLNYRDGMTFSWAHGRTLKIIGGSKNIAYGYDADGQRITKTVGDETTQYDYNNARGREIGALYVREKNAARKRHNNYFIYYHQKISLTGDPYYALSLMVVVAIRRGVLIWLK